MPREVKCSKCSRAVAVPEPPEAVWVSCPHCGERTVNLAALKSEDSAPLSCLVTLVWMLCAALSPLFAVAALAVLGGVDVLLGIDLGPRTNEAVRMVFFGT